MKAEMEDAFKVRKWVVVALALGGLGMAVGGGLVVRWCLWFWRSWGDLDWHRVRE